MFLREDLLSGWHLMSHSWKGGCFRPSHSSMFPACSPRWFIPGATASCCLLSASIWLLHLSHWLWAAANRGFCSQKDNLFAGSAGWMDLPHYHKMPRSDAKLGGEEKKWEERRRGKKRGEKIRREEKRGEDQDKRINRDIHFRGNLPLLPRKNNIKMSPVALASLFLQFKDLNGWLSVLLPSSSRWCPACRTDGSAMPQLLSHPWHLQKACRWGWFSSIDPTTVCSGPVAALGAAQPSD